MLAKFIILTIFAFSGTLTTSFDLRGVLNGDRMGSVPLGMTLGAGELDVEGICTKAGVACQNCSLAVTCVALPVGFLKVPLEECSEGHTCNAHLRRCSEQPVPECDIIGQEFTHTCEQVGIFPDAYDCRKFHLCSPPEGMPDGRPADHREALCPRHYGYNPQTAQCSIKLDNGQCKETPVPECVQVGQYGTLPSSSNHYYVCLKKMGHLYPQIFICPHGWHFYNSLCQPEPEKVNQNTVVNNSKINDGSTVGNKTEKNNDKTNVNTEKSTELPESNNEINEETTVETISRIDSFFSTEKSTTYAADTFLADKYFLSNYENVEDVAVNNDDSFNSFEDGFSGYWQ